MNYGEARDRALQLIDQYSISGTKIASSYNNQEDYILRVPGLINDAQLIIANGPRAIDEVLLLSSDNAVDVGTYYQFTLPEDMLDFNPGGLLVLDASGARYFTGFITLGEDYILVPKTLSGTAYLRYYRRPQLLPEKPLDTTPLDNIVIAQEPIPYYVAAMLVMRDDAFTYASLYNSWLDKISQIGKAPRPERGLVNDVYGMSAWGDGDV